MNAISMLLFISVASAIKIQSSFRYCRPESEIINFKKNCEDEVGLLKKIQCSVISNNFEFISRFNNDQFFEVDLIENKTIVYSLGGDIYLTTCLNVNEIDIAEKVDNCTREILVDFSIYDLKKTGYLSQQSIIRDKSELTECVEKIQYFDTIDSIEIIKFKNMITIRKNVKKAAALISEEDISLLKNFYEYYQSNGIAMLLIIIVMAISSSLKIGSILYILFTSKNKKKDLFYYFKSILLFGVKEKNLK